MSIVAIAAVVAVTTAHAEIVTYAVNLHFDPNGPSGSGFGPLGVGTVTGTITIDTSINATTPSDPGNVVAVNLTEKSNDGVYLSGFGTTITEQQFTDINPYNFTFFGSPDTADLLVSSTVVNPTNGLTYEFVQLQSLPIFDGIAIGPAFQFDFPFPSGGNVLPGNFDSITGTFDFLYGTVLPQQSSSVPEPSSFVLLGLGVLGLAFGACRRRRMAAAI